jgi:hypothetical protein
MKIRRSDIEGGRVLALRSESNAQMLEQLALMNAQLAAFLNRPEKDAAPIVVKAPDVTVQQAPSAQQIIPQQVRKWKFTINKNWKGQTTDIIATAMD